MAARIKKVAATATANLRRAIQKANATGVAAAKARAARKDASKASYAAA
jgi:hypothetical protein